MNFLKNISAAFKTAGGAVQGAVKVVEEKNRYYYHNLRDAENTVTEPYCIDIEAAQKRIDAAVEKLEALTREGDSEAEEEEITLDDVQEYTPTPEEEKEAEEAAFVPDGTVDEAVEAAEPAAEQPETTEPEKDESEEVPYE